MTRAEAAAIKSIVRRAQKKLEHAKRLLLDAGGGDLNNLANVRDNIHSANVDDLDLLEQMAIPDE